MSILTQPCYDPKVKPANDDHKDATPDQEPDLHYSDVPEPIDEFFNIQFKYNQVPYEGRVTPEHKDHNGKPASYHVVLNNVFFGYVSKNGKHWQVNEERPKALVELVGASIENVVSEW